MSTYELHDFYCDKSKLVLQIEERVCLQCSASVWQMISLLPANQNFEVGRSESLDVSLNSERVERNLSKIQRNKLMRLYFLEKVKSICVNKKSHIWYRGYEVHLWESINGISHAIDLAKEEILSLITISEHLDLWVINPADWIGFEKQANPFITLKAWKKLYENRTQLYKQTSQSHEQSYP
jgi:hypothetical protein